MLAIRFLLTCIVTPPPPPSPSVSLDQIDRVSAGLAKTPTLSSFDPASNRDLNADDDASDARIRMVMGWCDIHGHRSGGVHV